MSARKRRSGPTQSEADRLASGRVQLKLRVTVECREQLEQLATKSGHGLSSEVERLVASAGARVR